MSTIAFQLEPLGTNNRPLAKLSTVRIALYHNLPAGGALRCMREMVRRSTGTHQYDLYRLHDPESPDGPDDELDDVVSSINVTTLAVSVKPRTGPLWPIHRMARLLALNDAQAEIARRIDAGGYDLCFVHHCRLTQSPALLTRLRTPTVYYAQEPRRISYERPTHDAYPWARHPPDRWFELWFERYLRIVDTRAVSAATALACNSQFSAESFYRAYARDAVVIYLGVDQHGFRPTTSEREDYVVSVGALEPPKGHGNVVEALGLLPEANRPALRIVFERQIPHYEAAVRQLAERRRVRLYLHEKEPDSGLVGIYSKARATVCASRLEPFGLTPLESLSCGTPVVAVNEGGFRESIVDGVNGFLTDPSPNGLAEGLKKLLSGRLDTDRERLRATVSKWTWDKTVARLHELFDVVTRS